MRQSVADVRSDATLHRIGGEVLTTEEVPTMHELTIEELNQIGAGEGAFTALIKDLIEAAGHLPELHQALVDAATGIACQTSQEC
jgi:hypothetical protein